MNAAIQRLNERHSAFRMVKGDREEIEQVARVTSRETMPDFAGFNEDENETLPPWGEVDTFTYADESRAWLRGLTNELVEGLED